MKISEAIFKATSSNKKLVWHNIYDLERFLVENEDMELWITFKQANKLSEKWKMFAYYHGPLLDAAVIGYTNAGYEGVDKVKADYLLRAELAKDFILKKGEDPKIIIIDKSTMNKTRLLKFLTDSIHYIESELQQECPDSQEWKMSKLTNRDIRKVE